MSVRLFGYKRSSSSTTTSDVIVTDYDDGWALENLSIPVAHQKTWEGNSVSVGGVNDSIGTVYEDLTNYDADNNYLTAVTTLYISSNALADRYNLWGSGATDTALSGGARIVRINYLDSSYNPSTVDVYMSGMISSQVSATNIFRLNGMEVVSVGASGAAVGNISLISYPAGVPTKHLIIDAETNESYQGYYYVPNGKNLIITDAMCYPRLDNNNNLEFVYRIQEPKVIGTDTNYIENYEWAGVYKYSGSTNTPSNVITPIIVKDKCRIRIRARADTGAEGKAIGYFKGYLVDEKS